MEACFLAVFIMCMLLNLKVFKLIKVTDPLQLQIADFGDECAPQAQGHYL